MTITDEAALPGVTKHLELSLRQATHTDATLIQELYQRTPGYFEIISIPLPALSETQVELNLALADSRRYVELLTLPERALDDWQVTDPESGRLVVGLIDYKLDYPAEGDATVNLILIPGELQSRGIGRRSVGLLEERLAGRCKRLLAAIYGQNRRAQSFWRSLGYHFAIDAKPNMDWYAKELAAQVHTWPPGGNETDDREGY